MIRIKQKFQFFIISLFVFFCSSSATFFFFIILLFNLPISSFSSFFFFFSLYNNNNNNNNCYFYHYHYYLFIMWLSQTVVHKPLWSVWLSVYCRYIINSIYSIKDTFVSTLTSLCFQFAQSCSKSSKDGGACSELLLNSVKTQVSGIPEVQFCETPLGGAVVTILYFVCRSLSSMILKSFGNTHFVISVYKHHYQPTIYPPYTFF